MKTRIGAAGGVAFTVAVFLAVSICFSGMRHEKKRTYPDQILLIRHAEKATVEPVAPDLNARGKERAEGLFELFQKSKARPEPFPKPDFIFAARDSNSSHRPTQTVAPIASKLEISVNSGFSSDEPARLINELFGNPIYAGKTVLICWRHSSIVQLATHLGAKEVPAEWKDHVFDRGWHITYEKDGSTTFRSRPQHLLPGDAKK